MGRVRQAAGVQRRLKVGGGVLKGKSFGWTLDMAYRGGRIPGRPRQQPELRVGSGFLARMFPMLDEFEQTMDAHGSQRRRNRSGEYETVVNIQAQEMEELLPQFGRAYAFRTFSERCICSDAQRRKVEIYCIGWKGTLPALTYLHISKALANQKFRSRGSDIRPLFL